MKYFLIIICLLLFNTVFAQYVDREKGYYADGRSQFAEYVMILPPNKDKIPKTPHPTQTVVPFDSYYDTNILGIRRNPPKEPIVPGYNMHYSTRRATPYTRYEYLDVWCSEKKDYNKGACISKNYVTYYYPVRFWAMAVTTIPFRAHKIKKSGKRIAFFFWVDNVGLDAEYTYNAKSWHDSFHIPMIFATIDSLIPLSWIT